jgi:hypothetical protein
MIAMLQLGMNMIDRNSTIEQDTLVVEVATISAVRPESAPCWPASLNRPA